MWEEEGGGECERSRREGYQHHQLNYHPSFMVIAVLVICTVVYMPCFTRRIKGMLEKVQYILSVCRLQI